MKTVRVFSESDPLRPIGAFTYEPRDMPPGIDWVFAPVFLRPPGMASDDPVAVSMRSLRAIDVRSHRLFPAPRVSLATRAVTFLRRLVARFRRPSDEA